MHSGFVKSGLKANKAGQRDTAAEFSTVPPKSGRLTPMTLPLVCSYYKSRTHLSPLLWDESGQLVQTQVIMVYESPPTYLPQPLVHINGHAPSNFTLLCSVCYRAALMDVTTSKSAASAALGRFLSSQRRCHLLVKLTFCTGQRDTSILTNNYHSGFDYAISYIVTS